MYIAHKTKMFLFRGNDFTPRAFIFSLSGGLLLYIFILECHL